MDLYSAIIYIIVKNTFRHKAMTLEKIIYQEKDIAFVSDHVSNVADCGFGLETNGC